MLIGRKMCLKHQGFRPFPRVNLPGDLNFLLPPEPRRKEDGRRRLAETMQVPLQCGLGLSLLALKINPETLLNTAKEVKVAAQGSWT